MRDWELSLVAAAHNIRRNFPNNEEQILDYFVNLDGPTKIVIEAMCSWYWLYDLLTAHNFNVVISNPLKTKAIASACWWA